LAASRHLDPSHTSLLLFFIRDLPPFLFSLSNPYFLGSPGELFASPNNFFLRCHCLLIPVPHFTVRQWELSLLFPYSVVLPWESCNAIVRSVALEKSDSRTNLFLPLLVDYVLLSSLSPDIVATSLSFFPGLRLILCSRLLRWDCKLGLPLWLCAPAKEGFLPFPPFSSSQFPQGTSVGAKRFVDFLY